MAWLISFYIVPWIVLCLFSFECLGDEYGSAKRDGYGEDWEFKLSLNSSVELGGRVHRSSFPLGFVFGSAGAAYQYEGAVDEDGRGPSIWDDFVRHPGHVKGNATGDTAVDQYHRFEEDIQILKDLNLDAYRFSISWSRILPVGRGHINWAGVAYYNRFINELIRQGIEPYVTLYHWDLPLALEATGGWLDPDIVSAYTEFTTLCFDVFGDRVKYWMTINEPHLFAKNGYENGIYAPGRCSAPFGHCASGDSIAEPLIVVHNVLNAHALAVSIYRKEFRDLQKGFMGLVLDGMWFTPCRKTQEDQDAAQRANEYWTGWILDPIYLGDYPASMRKYGVKLPTFTKEQSELLKNSVDFLGWNHYTSFFATYDKHSVENNDVTWSAMCNGVLIGPQAALEWFHIYPSGMRDSLSWLRERYGNPPVYITENGFATNTNDEPWSSEHVQDYDRIKYHHDYMQSLLLAIQDGSDARGYFTWSFLDNFEWGEGYQTRFGFYQVDIGRSLERRAKASAFWLTQILSKETS
ncbi:hypothetical protein M758_9G035200 [Ceratodon purpureus]|nr:hypothetical protein M758_9G035200 [Ceratodon purpureus]